MTDEDTPILNIEGELVALGPLSREHLPLYLRWINDFDTTRTLSVPPRPMTLEQETAWYEHAAVDGARVGFTIYERSSGRAIGNCGLHEVDLANRRTVVGIMIGEPDARGRGYGTEAMRLLVDYAFTGARFAQRDVDGVRVQQCGPPVLREGRLSRDRAPAGEPLVQRPLLGRDSHGYLDHGVHQPRSQRRLRR